MSAEFPDGLLYHPHHGWARVEDDEALLGITWFAQDRLGEITYLELPAAGDEVRSGSAYAEVESLKALADVVAPLSGEILAVNAALERRPDIVNDDPYGEGWVVRVRLADPAEQASLLDAEAYTRLVAEQ